MSTGSGDATRAVVLLSGGLDSYTAAARTRQLGVELYALTVAYGQRHVREIAAARAVAAALGVARHLEIDLDLSRFGGSALTDDIPVPKDSHWEGDAPGSDVIPVTYVPARNTIFLSLALGWAEVLGATRIVIGVNAVDYSGYPDCRPQFIAAFAELASVATRAGVEGQRTFIDAPLLHLRKGEIIQLGLSLGLDYRITHSCYDPTPEGRPCQRCDSCRLRAAGFAEARMPDPLLNSHG